MARKSKLPNGLRIVTETIKGVESLFVGVGIRTGNRNELDNEIGLSHALEHLLFKGTKTRNSAALSELVETVGSYTNAFTGNEQTVYYIKGLKENAEMAFEVLADQVFNSVFPAEEQKKELEVIEQEIKRYLDDPNDVVYHNFIAAAFRGNRLATPIIGFAEQVLAYTPADMMAYYTKHYVPKNMVLSVAGNIKHKDVVALAEKYFGTYDKPFKKSRVKTPKWKPGQVLQHKPDENQVQAMIGWEAPGRNAITLHAEATIKVLNAVMSSGMSSKLFKEIREKRGLVYSVGSYYNDFDDTGYFAITGGTDNTKLNEFLEATAIVLKTFKAGLTEQDLVKAKNAIRSQYAMALEKVDSIALANLTSMQETKKPINLQEYLAEVSSVTIDEVKSMFDNIMASKPVLSIYGNAPQLLTGEISVDKFEESLRN